jgi:predicted 2-oxoglutarate/Fe(II)-dependent dioxygenase YbiX
MAEMSTVVKNRVLLFNDLLTLSECDTLCDHLIACDHQESRVVRGGNVRYAPDIRKTQRIRVDGKTNRFLADRILGCVQDVNVALGVDVHDIQRISWYSYNRGDFFARHRDNAQNPKSPYLVRQRKVAFVTFLNAPPEYAGGGLRFINVAPRIDDFTLQVVPGMAAAFTTDVYHEVTTVEAGRRFSAVTWFI